MNTSSREEAMPHFFLVVRIHSGMLEAAIPKGVVMAREKTADRIESAAAS
jgi:hypothetical protein